ncbi:MAG: FG-GAP-like repeat-containing protein, partial [Armatimonadota bacterium]
MGRCLALRGRSSRLVLLLLALTISSTSAFAGHFVDVGTTLNIPSANCVAWGDYDGDGYPDLFIGGIWGVHRAYLLHNNGNGTFTDVTVAMGLHIDSASWEDVQGLWGDFNNDGRLDLLVIGGSAHLPFLYRNDGDHFTDIGGAAAGFSSKWYVGSGGAWGDYDGDNWLDLYIADNYYGAPSYLYHNNRDGTFTEVTSAAGMDLAPTTYAQSCAWVDYNNDGLLDLIVSENQDAQGSQQIPRLYRNDGDGTFTDMALAAGLGASSLESVAVGDYDNNGFFDIYFGGNQNRGTLLEHNNGDGTFTNVHDTAMTAGANSVGAAWADYDNDGWLDLAQGNGTLPTYNETYPSVAYLFHNNRDGTFSEVSTSEGITASRKFRAAAWADFNLDGRMDLLLAGADAYSCLYQNIGAAGDGNWLRVRALTSATGDATDGSPVRDALGARVDVNLDNDLSFPKGRTLARLIDGGSGFMSQNEPIGQFGLGTATTVAVRVAFPNHHIVTQSGVAANQQIEIRDVQQGIGSIQGTVTDVRNGNPVIGGSVTCSYMSAMTDVAGAYRLPVVPEGTYSVTAGGAGFASLTMNNVVVVSGSATTVNFALHIPAGTISGTVRDAGTLAGIAGATVTCGPVTAATAANGMYTLASVPVGTGYSVTATAPGYDPNGEPGIAIADGQTVIVDITLPPQVGSVVGTVADATTKLPIGGAMVTCGTPTTTTNARGEYGFTGLRIGSYTVTASAAGHGSASASSVAVTKNATTQVDLALTAGAFGSIAGAVTDAANGAPIQHAIVSCGALNAATAADGTYTLTNVPAGDGYRIGASAGGYKWGSATGVSVVSGQTSSQGFALDQLPFTTGPQFQELPALPGLTNGVDVGWGDYDADGYPDLFLGGEHQGSVDPTRPPHGALLFHNNHDLTFTDTTASMKLPADAIEEDGVAWGDYNNDGYLDLLIGSGGGYPLLYRRDPVQFVEVGQAAGFRVSFSAGRGTTWCDYNGDNLLDAFCSNIFGPGYLMKNNGDGTFTEVSAASGLTPCDAAQSASWGDYNNDGYPDLVIARMAKPTLLFRNNGDGTFTDVSDASGVSAYVDAYSAVWGDYDNDGWLDLYITSGNYINPQLRRDALFHNNHDGTFT